MQAMKIPITLKSDANAGQEVKALIDSGAQGKFINRGTVRKLGLREILLTKPIPVYNVDGTPNQLGSIRNYVNVEATINGITKKERMLVTQLGKQDIILGIDWLKEKNPRINWKIGTLDFTPRKVVVEELPDEDEPKIQTVNMELQDSLLVELMPSAIIPMKGSEDAAGFDITATTTTVISPGTRMKIPTGLKTRAPGGTYLRIAPRSGLAVKGIDVAAGVVDRDYNGEIQVVLVNTTEAPFHVLQGDRIAQLIVKKIAHPEVHQVPQLPDTACGQQRFGSTGLKSQFNSLLDTTIRALHIANDDRAPLHIRLTTLDTTQQAEEDDEVMVSYSPGTGQIWLATIDGSPQEALTSLYIQAKINPAMEFAQEAGQQKEKVAIPEYLQPFAEVFEKKAAERFLEPRPYDHAIDLKLDFIPRDCKVYPLSPEEERKLNEFIDENLKKGYIRTSKSPQASPFFFVGKKDGNL